MRLHVFPPSPRATKVLALANHLGLDCEIRLVDMFKGDQNKPEFVALNPNKKMPVLEDDGFVLWECNAVFYSRCSSRYTAGGDQKLPTPGLGRAFRRRRECEGRP